MARDDSQARSALLLVLLVLGPAALLLANWSSEHELVGATPGPSRSTATPPPSAELDVPTSVEDGARRGSGRSDRERPTARAALGVPPSVRGRVDGIDLLSGALRESSPETRLGCARRSLEYSIALLLDHRGEPTTSRSSRTHPGANADGEPERFVVNGRGYCFSPGRFPDYDELEVCARTRRPPSGVLLLHVEARAAEVRRILIAAAR